MSALLLYLVVFAGGVLTILSPCILPVLPFVFARMERPFVRETLPMLVGLVFSFVVVAMAATAGAAWVAQAADISRWVALVVLAVAGVTLLSPRVAELLSRPLVRRGNALLSWKHEGSTPSSTSTAVQAGVIGLATGLLWAPCAGPILGLVVALSIRGGAPSQIAVLFVMFALGASASLAVGLFAGGRVLGVVRRYLSADVWIRRGLGTLSLAGVMVIALGLDASLFSGGGVAQTAGAEDALIKAFAPTAAGAQARRIVAVQPPSAQTL